MPIAAHVWLENGRELADVSASYDAKQIMRTTKAPVGAIWPGRKFMTISKLNKYLTQLIAEGHGRKQVLVDKRSFRHPLEADGCMILPVDEATIETFNIADDDGGTKVTTRGVECTQTGLVLYGNDRAKEWS